MSLIQPVIVVKEANSTIVLEIAINSGDVAMAYSDARGQVVTAWVAQYDLLLVNPEDKATFQRRDDESVQGLTVQLSGKKG